MSRFRPPRPPHELEAELDRERERGWSGYVVAFLGGCAFAWILVPALAAVVKGTLP